MSLKGMLYIDTPYRPDSGYFAKPKDLIGSRYTVHQWIGCRDVWHYQLRDLPLFFYSHGVGETNNIIAFMEKIETMVNVQPRSHFGPTQRKTVMWIEPSRWWTHWAMRRSLFTILLRVARKYHVSKDNFEDALFSEPYTESTEYAVRRFLKGYTHYTGRRRGWYRTFCLQSPTQSDVDAWLVKK